MTEAGARLTRAALGIVFFTSNSTVGALSYAVPPCTVSLYEAAPHDV